MPAPQFDPNLPANNSPIVAAQTDRRMGGCFLPIDTVLPKPVISSHAKDWTWKQRRSIYERAVV